jgi:hypothetical protein
MSVSTFTHRALETHAERLADGRTATLRRAVPSDAPRISVAFGPRHVRWGRDAVAFDDHGRLVGHGASALDVTLAPGWNGYGLEDRLGTLADS